MQQSQILLDCVRIVIVAVAVLIVLAVLRHSRGAIACTEPVLMLRQWPEEAPSTGSAFTIVTLNVAEERSMERMYEDFASIPALQEADLLLLQEAVHAENGRSTAGELAERLQLHLAFASGAPPTADEYEGVAILSRKPLHDVRVFELPRFGLHLRSRCRIALGATVNGPRGPVRVICLHLDTRINADRRLDQLAPVLEAARAFDGPVILGGDFNTNPFWWVEHLVPVPFVQDQASAVVAELGRAGFGTPLGAAGATNDYLRLKLDWIFLRGLEAAKWGVDRTGFSDHHAVWVRLTQL